MFLNINNLGTKVKYFGTKCLILVKNVFNEGCKLKIFNKDDFEEMFDVRPIEWVAEEKIERE